jgi:hypothetical protein
VLARELLRQEHQQRQHQRRRQVAVAAAARQDKGEDKGAGKGAARAAAGLARSGLPLGEWASDRGAMAADRPAGKDTDCTAEGRTDSPAAARD